jgi:hypothetical protein
MLHRKGLNQIKNAQIKIAVRIWEFKKTTFQFPSTSIAIQVCSYKLKNNLMVKDIFVGVHPIKNMETSFLDLLYELWWQVPRIVLQV